MTAEQRAAHELEPAPNCGSLKGFLGVLMKADSKLAATPEGKEAARTRYRQVRTLGDARACLREGMGKVQAEMARRAQ
jgi:hypothetical protein